VQFIFPLVSPRNFMVIVPLPSSCVVLPNIHPCRSEQANFPLRSLFCTMTPNSFLWNDVFLGAEGLLSQFFLRPRGRIFQSFLPRELFFLLENSLMFFSLVCDPCLSAGGVLSTSPLLRMPCVAALLRLCVPPFYLSPSPSS